MPEHYAKGRLGLTLIELIVIVTVLALVTATVSARLGDRIHSAAMGQAISQWKFADGQLRSRARRSGQPAALHLELGTSQLNLRFEAESGMDTKRSLGRDVHITRYVSATREVNYGPITIQYSDRGTTETFAIELAGKRERRWILIAGITGQASEIKDESEINLLFERLLPDGVHAG